MRLGNKGSPRSSGTVSPLGALRLRLTDGYLARPPPLRLQRYRARTLASCFSVSPSRVRSPRPRASAMALRITLRNCRW